MKSADTDNSSRDSIITISLVRRSRPPRATRASLAMEQVYQRGEAGRLAAQGSWAGAPGHVRRGPSSPRVRELASRPSRKTSSSEQVRDSP